MPYTNRPYEDENKSTGRRVFRSLPDFKRDSRNGNGNNGNNGRNERPAPPEVTNAENFYYLKQMSSKTPMVIIMTDGEEIRGCIEWYDKNALKVNRDGAPNILVQKHWIKYMYKADELSD